MASWGWLQRRRLKRLRARLVAANGYVRGFHADCPASSPGGFLGTYRLVLNDVGVVECEACGTEALSPKVKHRYPPFGPK